MNPAHGHGVPGPDSRGAASDGGDSLGLRLLGLLCTTQIALWTLVPALLHRALPLDVVESYMSGREWVILTHKHPQLPGWILELSRDMTGVVGWPAYVISQLFIAATLVLVFLLGRELLDARRAICGTLLLCGIYYFSIPTPEFNHNIAQMPIWVAIILLVRKATLSGGFLWWIVLGAVAALGLYAKFTIAIVIGAGGLWLLIDERGRHRLRTPGPWLGLVVFLFLAAPLAVALVERNYLPFQYAAEKSEAGDRNPLVFLFTQLLDHVGLLLVTAAAFLGRTIGPSTDKGPAREAVRFLAFFTLIPLAVVLIACVVSGARPMWGAPLWSLSGLIIMALVPRLDRTAFHRIVALSFALLVLAPAAYAAALLRQDHWTQPLRVYWPQADIASRFADIWRQTTHAPLHIVGGEQWTAGLIGSVHPDAPSLFLYLNPAYAPWITPERIRREGMLVVWRDRTLDPRPFGTVIATGTETFQWSRDPAKPSFTINYAIIPPASAAKGN